MAMPGELEGVHGTECDCGAVLELHVCMSAAGYYLGYECDACGPWSRDCGYFKTRDEAETALVIPEEYARDTDYKPGPSEAIAV